MIIYVNVKQGSSKNEVKKLSGDTYLVSTTARAESGKANAAVIKMIAKEFKVSFKKIFIKNSKSRKKIIEIDFE
ncbi:DUF167 domain-containing protein [Candidatus Pacearchaeota archaeon]|nr:DUF167 domain-containing protein [Candidatus Pacearchaeota archaeon]